MNLNRPETQQLVGVGKTCMPVAPARPKRKETHNFLACLINQTLVYIHKKLHLMGSHACETGKRCNNALGEGEDAHPPLREKNGELRTTRKFATHNSTCG